MSNFTTLGLSLIVLTTAGCTRSQDENTKLALSLPSMESLKSTSKLSSKSNKIESLSTDFQESYHLVINITGGGTNVLCTIESRDGTRSGPCGGAYPNLSVDLPQSDGVRLIQVLYVLDTAGGTSFMYGDTEQVLKGESASANITVNSFSSDGAMAKLRGKITLGTAPAPIHPTGLMEIKYIPIKNGMQRPMMTIMRSEVYGGWFLGNVFNGFKVFWEINGQNVFPDYPTGIDMAAISAIQTAAPTKIAKYVESANFVQYVGWFGPGSDYNSITRSAQSSDCSVNHYASCLHLITTPSFKVSRFIGPFRPKPSVSPEQFVYESGGNLSISLLPETNTVFDGVKVIKATGITDPAMLKPYIMDDGKWDCNRLKFQFPNNQLDLTIAQLSSFTKPSVTSTDVLFFCPKKNDFLTSSAVVYPDMYNNFSRDGYSGPYLYLNLTGGYEEPGDVKVVYLNECHELSAGSYQGKGSSYPVNSTTTLTFTNPASPNEIFFESVGCSGPNPTSNLSISSSSTTSSGSLYFKPKTVGPAEISFSSDSTEHNATPRKIRVEKLSLRLTAPSHLNQGECGAVTIDRVDSRGNAVTTNGLSITLDAPSANVGYFSDAGCSSGISGPPHTVSMGTGSSSKTFYVKKTDNNSFSVALNSSAHAAQYNLNAVTILDRGANASALSKIMITVYDGATAVSNLLPGRCYNVLFQAVNQQGKEIPFASDSKFTLQSAAGVFFPSNISCSGASVDDVKFMAGSSRANLRFQMSASAAGLAIAPLLNGPSFQETSPVTISLVNAPAPYIGFTALPNWKNLVVPSIDFGPGIQMQILYGPAGASIKCWKNGSTDCSSQISTSGSNTYFTWTAASAVANDSYSLEVSSNGTSARYHFSPAAQFGPNFKAMNCDATLPASGSTVAAATINTSLGSNSVVCIKPGTTITMANALIISGSHHLIGAIGTGTAAERVRTEANAANGFSVTGDIVASGATIANIDLYMDMSSAPNANAVNLTGVLASGGTAQLRMSNMLWQLPRSASSYYGVYIPGDDFDISAMFDRLDIQVTVGSTDSATTAFYVAGTQAALALQSVKFTNLGVSPSNIPTLLYITNNAGATLADVLMDRVEFSGPAMALYGMGMGGGPFPKIRAERLKVTSSPVTLGGSVNGSLTVNMKMELYINQSLFNSVGPSPLFSLTSGTSSKIAVNNSIISGASTGPVFYSLADSGSGKFSLNGNQFIRTAATNAPFLYAPTSSSAFVFSPDTLDGVSTVTSLSTTGRNRFCGVSSGLWTYNTSDQGGQPIEFTGTVAFPAGVVSGTDGAGQCLIP